MGAQRLERLAHRPEPVGADVEDRGLLALAGEDAHVGEVVGVHELVAVRAVTETQGIYNQINRPNWARGAIGRTVLTFKQYSLMYLEMVNRMWKSGPAGKRAVLYMLAVLLLLSGEEGLPFAQDLDDLIDTIGQLVGYDTNMKRNKRRLAYEILGKEGGDLFLYGISSVAPLDFSGRLGMGNLIPGTGMFKVSGAENQAREVGEVVGPAGSFAVSIMDAFEAAAVGNYGKAMENLSPKAVKDARAGADMAITGTNRHHHSHLSRCRRWMNIASDASHRNVTAGGMGDQKAAGLGKWT